MSVRLLTGDCRTVLPTLPAESVHCVVTSPPYFGLRDYGTGQWEGGDPDCKHVKSEIRTGLGMAKLGEKYRGGGHKAATTKEIQFSAKCELCGAIRQDRQIGLEASLADYVETIVAVFREVRRVLRKDGTVWCNMGDSYHGGGGGNYGDSKSTRTHAQHLTNVRNNIELPGLKPKDLMMVPARLALALQADGWWLRSEIVWAKPNPMPESVTDRPTSAHEKMFLLAKSERYFFDQEAVREPTLSLDLDHPSYRPNSAQIALDGRKEYSAKHEMSARNYNPAGRNIRNVWTIATQPFSAAHFATFPPALVEPCIKAGCPKGGTVLDPFAGAGTTGLVADRLGRDALLIELNPDYAEMARRRVEADAGMFAEVDASHTEEASP